MTYYQDNHIRVYNKDCRSMNELVDNSVQMVCSSPPYWGLRKYSGNQDLIWGDNHHEHQWINNTRQINQGGAGKEQDYGIHDDREINNGFCSLCGAWRGAFGLEPTPELYVDHTIRILREIKRVLRKDGCVFWNIGDSYASGFSTFDKGDLKSKDLCLIPFRVALAAQADGWYVRSVIIWSKLNPMPESVRDRPTESHEYILLLTKSSRYYWDSNAVRESGIIEGFDKSSKSFIFGEGFSLQDTFSKRSVTPTSMSHNRFGEIAIILATSILKGTQLQTNEGLGFLDTEKGQKVIDCIFGRLIANAPSMARAAMFSHRLMNGDITAKSFFQELENLQISITNGDNLGISGVSALMCDSPLTRDDTNTSLTIDNTSQISQQSLFHNTTSYLNTTTVNDTLSSKIRGLKTKGEADISSEQHHGQDICPPIHGRNLRSVWTFATQPYPEAHFATFPEALPERCIKAGTPEYGCCDKCRTPYEREIETTREYQAKDVGGKSQGGGLEDGKRFKDRYNSIAKTHGWQQVCKCKDSQPVPSLVLDPFAGSGTTLWVAKKLGRKAVGYELSEEYCKLIIERNRQQVMEC